MKTTKQTTSNTKNITAIAAQVLQSASAVGAVIGTGIVYVSTIAPGFSLNLIALQTVNSKVDEIFVDPIAADDSISGFVDVSSRFALNLIVVSAVLAVVVWLMSKRTQQDNLRLAGALGLAGACAILTIFSQAIVRSMLSNLG